MCFLASIVWAENPQIDKVLDTIDKLYRSNSGYAEFEMRIETPHWKRTLKLKSWSLGKDKTFLRILAPKKDRGVATLRVKSEMWNYLPKTNKVIKVPPSMMMSSWMGSDFKNDDLVSEFNFLDDYQYEYMQVENPREDLLYIKATPREGRPIIWGYVLMKVRRKDFIPVQDQFFDEKNKLMRTINYREIKQFGKKKIPSIMEVIPNSRKGNKTVIIYHKAEFDLKVDKDTFSLRNLKKRI
jgi:outer membrane lipoprotein-sorting protein